MDFGMREWLTLIVVLLIVGVLLDGWRRMRQSRQASIKMSLSMHKGTEKDELMEFGSELPNGGARVVGERDEEDTRRLTQSVQESFAQTRAPSLKNRIPEQVTLNLEEEVPMLMEAVEGSAEAVSSARDVERREPTFDESYSETIDTPIHEAGTEEPVLQPEIVDALEAELSDVDMAVAADTEYREPEPTPTPTAEPAQPDEVLVINVMAPEGARLNGSVLLDSLLECGMRFGDMQIFHRHVGADGEGSVMFSMANMVVPGTFDLNNMQNFETPGVSLFMSLPLGCNAMDAFNCMAETAQTLATNLGGELKDEHRSFMTAQTLEHCRERIREYERKRLT